MTRKSLSWIALMLLVVLLAAPLTGCNRSATGDDVAQLEEQMSQEAAQNTTPEATTAPDSTDATPEATTAPDATTAAPVATEPPAAETPAATPAATPVTVTEVPTEVATPVTNVPGTHVVQAGENLFRIALNYGLSADELAKANNITKDAIIYVGQILTIPAGGTPPVGGQPTPAPVDPGSGVTVHVVQPGENLFRIALLYQLDYDYLARYNGITDPTLVYVGQQIKIPPR
ncbi:MAG: LysM domain-containing protein [Anaerolineae bacterium]|jgi:LysM repeat protein|nr:LysM domain-containing protein [Anaerolineae bacterium]